MHETPEDLGRLQQLLDRSYESSGAHMRSIITPERRVSAGDLSERLQGMVLLSLATVTAKGEPRVGPVDGIFYRGEFWFGSARNSMRFRHIAKRPQVSATHLQGEPFSVTVHGRAATVELRDPAHEGFWDYCREIYGKAWDEWWTPEEVLYARIEATHMFTYHMDPAALEELKQQMSAS